MRPKRSLSLPPPVLSKGKQRNAEPELDIDGDDHDEAGPEELQQGLKRWRQWIAERVRSKKRRQKPAVDELIEICDSVFAPFAPGSSTGSAQAALTLGPPAETGPEKLEPRTLDHEEPLGDDVLDAIAADLRNAIAKGRHPRLNAAGSSGSYFLRDSNGVTTAIFKPKDEDPYGRLNPKWIKWLHRTILSPLGFGFGRSCLVPNFSYLSEAAASLLDHRLGSYIVPKTGISRFSSPSFFYDWVDRHAAHRKEDPKPLPEKPGSLQLFAHGFKDASVFLNEHPWPGRLPDDAVNLTRHRARRRKQTSRFTKWLLRLKREEPLDDDVASIESIDVEQLKASQAAFDWTAPLMEDFRLQLEQLIILDMLMRNTDRGLDNFMVKYCVGSSQAKQEEHYCPSTAHVHIAAIDNSLAFPHKHPSGWRNYSYGWLFLPKSLMDRPFAKQTQRHYLRLLTSTSWWAELTRDLRVLFSGDPDFSEKTFRRQMAVMKGQAYNIVESLSAAEGPLELFERQRHLVWDDLMEVPDLGPTFQSFPAPSGRPSAYARWSSRGSARSDEESLLVPKKWAIKERLETVHQNAFFRSC